MEPVDPNRQVVIGQEGILSSREELSNFEKLAILARQRGNATGTDISEEFRAEVRLHSVLKHRLFVEVVKRYKPQIVIDVYGGSILYVGEENSRKLIPEKSVEVGTAGRVLSLMDPSLQKYIINDRRYDNPDLEKPKQFGNAYVFATKHDIRVDDIPKYLRQWKIRHFSDDAKVLILIDPYEAISQKQLKSLLALRADLSHAAFLIFSKLNASNAIPPRTQLQPRKGETDMPQHCLRQCFLDSQNVYTLYSFGISNRMWRESIETAFGGKGTIAPFNDAVCAFFQSRIDDLKAKIQDPELRPITKTKWQLEIKQITHITDSILQPSSSTCSSQHLEDVICIREFHPETLNVIIPLCFYSVMFDDRRKIFNINNINSINSTSNIQTHHDNSGRHTQKFPKKKNNKGVKKRKRD